MYVRLTIHESQQASSTEALSFHGMYQPWEDEIALFYEFQPISALSPGIYNIVVLN